MAAPDRGRERRAARSSASRSSDLPARSPARSRAATAATAPTIPTSGWSRRSSARSTSSSSTRCARRARRSRMPAGSRPRHEEQIATGVMIGSGIGGIEGIAETAITLKERGPRRVSPFFIPGPPDQSGVRLCVDRVRPEGPEPCGGHRLLDRRACDRRCGRLIALGDADVMVAGGTESPVNRISLAGFAAVPRALHQLQRHADQGLAALRQGPRRFRDGRGRRRAWCWRSTSTPRRAAPRSMPS